MKIVHFIGGRSRELVSLENYDNQSRELVTVAHSNQTLVLKRINT